jgi:hypothetical protein
VSDTTGYKRLTMNVSEPLADELQQLADDQGIELTDLFRRAVIVYKHLPAQRPRDNLWREFRNGTLGGVAFAVGIAGVIYAWEGVSALFGWLL